MPSPLPLPQTRSHPRPGDPPRAHVVPLSLTGLAVHLIESICLLTVVATVVGLVLLDGRAAVTTPTVDTTARTWMLAHTSSLLGAASTVSAVTATLVVLGVSIVTAGGLWWRTRDAARSLLPVLAVLVADTAGAATKVLVARPRPGGNVAGVLETFAFPSGHTVSIAAFATSLVLVWCATGAVAHRAWRGGVLAALVVAAVMASRLVLDEHWTTDVLAGAAIGVSAAFLARWCLRRSTPELGAGDR